MSDASSLARSLTVAERLELIADLWDTVVRDEGDALATTDEERAELDRRIEAHDLDPGAASPWNEVRQRLRR
ncbi:MAG: addiction module protein [Myxococcota bacterium]|nr:addiction module protein [Myxococcota bacterium]